MLTFWLGGHATPAARPDINVEKSYDSPSSCCLAQCGVRLSMICDTETYVIGSLSRVHRKHTAMMLVEIHGMCRLLSEGHKSRPACLVFNSKTGNDFTVNMLMGWTTGEMVANLISRLWLRLTTQPQPGNTMMYLCSNPMTLRQTYIVIAPG